MAVSPASSIPEFEPASEPENDGPVLILRVELLPSVIVSLTVRPVRITLPMFLTVIL